jgi:hypothetical protein
MFPYVKPSTMDQVTWFEVWMEGHPAVPDGLRIYIAEWRGIDWVYVPGSWWGDPGFWWVDRPVAGGYRWEPWGEAPPWHCYGGS